MYSRRSNLNQQILKLQGEIRDAGEGLNVIESRCVVSSVNVKKASFAGHEMAEKSEEEEDAEVEAVTSVIPSEI